MIMSDDVFVHKECVWMVINDASASDWEHYQQQYLLTTCDTD